MRICGPSFDGALEDVFELQDKVAVSVAGVIEPALQRAEMRRSAERPTTDLSAYDLYLRALAVFYPVTKERVYLALGLLEQAIAIDRHYCQRCQRAGSIRRGYRAMIGLVDRALALNPSYARGWFVSGLLRVFAGQHDLAIGHLETALRLSPRESMGSPISLMGLAHFFKRRFDEAAAKLVLAIQDHPGFPVTYRHLAACCAHMGRLDEARATIAKLRAITPVVGPSNLPFCNPEDRELYLSGLSLAGGNEM